MVRMSKVGSFWFYHGRPIVAAVPLQDGIDDGHWINGPFDHLPYWETVRRSIPALRAVEYDEVPHGRVLFAKAEARYRVYLDNVLLRDEVKQVIRHHFQLPAETPFDTDPHYTTTPADLERLFDDLP
jgi:hypothetical protein